MDSRKTIILTGSTSGIGLEISNQLCREGNELILPVRNLEKGNKLKASLQSNFPDTKVHLYECDLASMEQIRAFATKVEKDFPELDVLINNAGVWDMEPHITEDGIERIFGVNFLAPFLLSNLLTEKLKSGKPGRIVNVASALHKGPINFDDIEFNKGFSGFKAYSQSKLALILYTRLKAEKEKDSGLRINAVHPGMIKTDLARSAGWFSRTIFRLMGKSTAQGASTPVFVATDESIKDITGKYFVKKKISQGRPESTDMASAEKLWEIAEEKYKAK